MDTKNVLIAVVVVLALALIGSIVWGANKNKEAQGLQADNMEINEALDAMTELRDDLAREVDSLANEYDMLASENVELSGNLSTAQDELAKAQAALSRAKRNAAAELNDVRAQIEELRSAKAGLETSIAALQSENDSLRVRTGVLEADLAMSEEERATLVSMTETMEGEIQDLTLANFKASAFEVLPQQKNGKVTANNGRARQVSVSFDLANVPAEYQGVRPLYLVITDDKGTPIERTDYLSTTVNVGGNPVNIMAVEGREENISESQRISFVHQLENKLDPGYYRATVYTDVSILGAANFLLR